MEGADNGTSQLLTYGQFADNTTILQNTTGNSSAERPYPTDWFGSTWLGTECVLALLVVLLTVALRKRDFLQVFVLFLLVPILLEIVVDVFARIFGKYEEVWFPSRMNEHNGTVTDQDELDYFKVTLFLIRGFIFRSTLFSSVVAFYCSHKAITRPVKTSNTDFYQLYIKVQVFPFVLTILDNLMMLGDFPEKVIEPARILTTSLTLLTCIILLLQVFLSFPVFCFRRDEFTTSSPQDQIRYSKWRLFWFLVFQGHIQAMNVPYMNYARYVLEEGFCGLFGLSADIRFGLAKANADLHFLFLQARPLFFLLYVLLFLSPYRRQLRRFLCFCCYK